jgi:predicted nuclease of predicted toxin-antitoxin system
VKIKVDENIGGTGVALLRDGGHDDATVHDQELSGATDDQVFDACLSENRTLITLDRDFGHVPRFSPKRSAGIVVVELGGPASQQALHSRLRQFLKVATSRPVHGELWIVEPGRIRVHPDEDTE